MYSLIFSGVLSRVLNNLFAYRREALYVVYELRYRASLLDSRNFLSRHDSVPSGEHVFIWQRPFSKAGSTVETAA